jgi:divalent anion:Na+ symporter, DASS family
MTTNSNATSLTKAGFKIPSVFWVALFALLLWFLPVPAGLEAKTWHLFAIFATTIIAIVANVLPMGALAIIALAVLGITKTLTIQEALSTFSSQVVWLILLAFLLARGVIKTGLGTRIAYYFVRYTGKNTIGLGYGLVATETILAPFTPSNTARGAGILYPIVTALSDEYKSNPQDKSERKIGSYLMKLAYQTNVVTSAMFLTATASNPLIASLAGKIGVEMTWTAWGLAAFVPGFLNLAILPLIIYWLYPPEIKHTPEAPNFAREKLKAMGPLKKSEWIVIATFGLLLGLWVFGQAIGVDATVAALLGLSILLATEVLTWDDILKEHNAWHTFIWFATLLMMSNYLAEFGMIEWFGNHMQGFVSSYHWLLAFGMIAFMYFYAHYAFATMTAHVSSLFSPFAVVAITAGAPAPLVVFLLSFLSSLCAGITHYGTGTGPVYFAAQYITLKDWWRIGGIVSVINIAIWGLIGAAWWKVLGLW